MVVSFQVFEHLADPDAYLHKCVQLACPGGSVVISTVNRLRLKNRASRGVFGAKLDLMDPMHFREYTPREIIALGPSRSA